MPALTIGEQILAVLKSALETWKTYLEKKKELYELHLTKEKNKALDVAEQAFDLMEDFVQLTFLKTAQDEQTHRVLKDLSNSITKFKKKFDRLD